MHTKKFLLCLFIVAAPFIYCDKIGQKIKFVNDLIDNENVPSILSVKACWPKHEMVQFMKNVKISIHFLQEVDYELQFENNNKVWFLIDIKCNGAMDFLKMVK